MISFIVPAHNEQACLGRTLQAIHDSARSLGHPYEIIVVDDASTDATADIAQQNNARVVSVNHRQIAATRNSGARAANGARLFFVDADTTINPRAVAAALRKMDKGAVGGGAPVWLGKNERVPLYIWLLCIPSLVLPKMTGFSGGAFMFCTREAFHATGGFNERLYWGEESLFALALKREGWFAGLWEPVLTSGRRARKISGLKFLAGAIGLVLSPVKMFTRRSSVQKIWYDSNRADDDIMPTSLAARLSNGITLLLIIVVLTEDFWGRISWSMTPLSNPLGQIRFLVQLSICLIGLFIFWAVALVLLVNLLRQKRWTGLMQSTALIAFCLWNGWGATNAVLRLGKHFYHWLA